MRWQDSVQGSTGTTGTHGTWEQGVVCMYCKESTDVLEDSVCRMGDEGLQEGLWNWVGGATIRGRLQREQACWRQVRGSCLDALSLGCLQDIRGRSSGLLGR